MLNIPAGVLRSSNNAATFKPYDAADALGDNSPTSPLAPKPTAAKKSKCGAFGAILLTVIAVAVTAILKVPVTNFITAALKGAGIPGTRNSRDTIFNSF